MCTLEADCQTRIESLKSIIRRIQLAKDSMDFGKLPGLQKEYLVVVIYCHSKLIWSKLLGYTTYYPISLIRVVSSAVREGWG